MFKFFRKNKEDKVDVKTDNIAEPFPPTTETSAESPVHEEPKKPEIKTESFNVAGTSHRQKEIKSLCCENDIFSYTKRDLIDFDYVDERIYKFEADPVNVQIIPEPDNPYDPKALKVIIDDVHVGYIKKGSTGRIRNILKKDPKITADIYGGSYKIIFSDYDYDTDKETYTLEKDTSPFVVKLHFSYEVPEK